MIKTPKYLAFTLKFDIKEDKRHAIYHQIEEMTFDDIKDFHKAWFKNNDFIYAIMGSNEIIKKEQLEKYDNPNILILD